MEKAACRKVTFTCLHLMHGGAERVIVSLANALALRGYEVEILCTYRLCEPAYPLEESVRVTYLTNDRPNRDAFKAAIAAKNPVAILREGVRAVGILRRKKNTMRRAIAGVTGGAVISTRHEHTLLLSRYGQKGVYKIAQLHSDHAFAPKLISEMKKGYGNIDVFQLLTEECRGEVEGFFEGAKKRPACVTIPNFIEEGAFCAAGGKKEQIIAAGRLHPDKDFSALLRIFAKVHEKYPSVRLVIAGEGELEETLRGEAKALGISDFVDLPGALPQETLFSEMAASLAYALTSVSESFGLVLAEAMASGTVPVAFDVRVGPRAILEEGVTGFLIPERDEELFAEKLGVLLEDAEKRKTMESAAKTAAEAYRRENVMRAWEELLQGGSKE